MTFLNILHAFPYTDFGQHRDDKFQTPRMQEERHVGKDYQGGRDDVRVLTGPEIGIVRCVMNALGQRTEFHGGGVRGLRSSRSVCVDKCHDLL